MKPNRLIDLLSVLCVALLAGPAFAVYEKPDGFPWNLTLAGHHDVELAQALGSGFFMNVGPTGIRAQITHEHPAFFTVRYVFKNSPAAGKVNIGDVIVGANGKGMTVPHQFGRRNVTGWDGPMTEMAKLIEDSQAGDGELELIIWPGGDRGEQKTVTVQIEPVGRFSETFPFNCERSDKLMIELCDWLGNEYQRAGRFEGRVHTHSAGVLALMASGDDRYAPLIHRIMQGYHNKRYDSFDGGGFQCWNFGYDGIVMGEYYILAKDRQMLPAMDSLAVCMAESQEWVSGGYSHRPTPFILHRMSEGGPKGYGAMSGTAGHIMLAQSIFKAGGVAYDEDCYQRLHQAYLFSFTDKGYIDYGFKSWDHAVIELKGESRGKATSERGIGYRVMSGMEEIEQYDIVWPTREDPRYRPTDWLRTEKDKARVYVMSEHRRLVIRDMSMPEPRGPIPATGQQVGHIMRSGLGALAHAIGNGDNASWGYMADHLATACAVSHRGLLDGHASTLMHTLWGSLGASRADQRLFRQYMDGIKWWFIMAQTHDGSYVPMPGRDYASTDHVYANRTLPTATAALILAVKERQLMITGADGPEIPKPTGGGDGERDRGTSAARSVPQPSLLGEGFTVEHCVEAAEMLQRDAPFAQVLRQLERDAAQGGEQGQEAEAFAERLRAYIAEQNARFLELAETEPAKTHARSREYLRRMLGVDMPDVQQVREVVDNLGSDNDVRTLSRYYEQVDRLKQLAIQRGSPESTLRQRQQLANVIQRFLDRQDVRAALRHEAEALLVELDVE